VWGEDMHTKEEGTKEKEESSRSLAAQYCHGGFQRSQWEDCCCEFAFFFSFDIVVCGFDCLLCFEFACGVGMFAIEISTTMIWVVQSTPRQAERRRRKRGKS
jgi:hypothetical protein